MSKDINANEAKEMNVTEHLSELRNRLIVTAIMFIVLFIVAFIYHKQIYRFFEKDMPFQLAVTSLGEIIWIYFTLAGVVALAGTIPVLSLQLWLFIKPGLTKRERRASLMYIPVIFLLFLGGLIFGYFMFIKLILPFLLSLNDGMFTEIFTVGNYFRFVFKVSLPFALFFEVPIIAMFLTQLGILTPAFMKKIRKYAYFIMVIIGAAVTPPDFLLQIVVAVPLIILYEISIYLSHFVYRKKIAKHEAFMEETN